ncbi:MAG: twin-arginine translocase TatA/TatE family subunit [Negativicutes bacterium]|nr:twin-arginine translocase TatA/TatE family subunit [Negativicutes bacterium]MDR3591027.1 twin-arginine translocase TatA/TatE family subunit [Negativicutes bacterium]
MLNFSMPELILILVIALVVFGPGKLPEVGKAVGKGLNEFRRAMSNDHTKDETINIEAKPVEHKDDEKKTDEEKKVDAKKAEETK